MPEVNKNKQTGAKSTSQGKVNYRYNPELLYKKWSKYWLENKVYKAYDFDKRPKKYILVEYPYPSAAGLHMGHTRNYAGLVDPYVRFLRMNNYKVLYPMGWDAFGLPAYNYALKVNKSPQEVVKENIKNFKEQLLRLGISVDWDREINTSSPEYYKWTQWIFLQLYNHWYDPEFKREDGGKGKARHIAELPIPEEVKKKGEQAVKEYKDAHRLAYKDKIEVFYCPSCKTAVAREEVEKDGTHERCHKPVEVRTVDQWILRMTAYADRLIDDLQLVDFDEHIKQGQINWIGRKYGAEIAFDVVDEQGCQVVDTTNDATKTTQNKLWVFTTRADTLMGVTFLVVSPNHWLVRDYLDKMPNKQQVKKYVQRALTARASRDFDENKEKTGQITGLYAVHPITGQKVPIFVTDYVLEDVGTGAVMGVPAHDQRDYEFAKKYGLEIKVVIAPKQQAEKADYKGSFADLIKQEAYVKPGVLVNSGKYNGLTTEQAKKHIVADLQKQGLAKSVKYYKLRDWNFSRQHYWGEPIPIVYCQKCGTVPLPTSQLPLKHPKLDDYHPMPDGSSPLLRAKDWINTTCPVCGGPAKRETDVMPTWAGSNWYYVRYLDPHNNERLVDYNKAEYWLPVDFYDGGAEHTTMHLLYSRFIYKFLYDLGVVPYPEPYQKRKHHGMVLASDGKKMSKSRGNVINPNDVVNEYGADAVRVYMGFMGPYDADIPWSDEALRGVKRFLDRLWEYILNYDTNKQAEDDTNEQDREYLHKLHTLIKKITEDIQALKHNTAIAAYMEFLNEVKNIRPSKQSAEILVKLIAPYAPFMAEELWEKLGNKPSVHLQEWPKYNEKYLQAQTVRYVVQVNGKVRGNIDMPINATKEQVIEQAKHHPNVEKYLKDKEVKKVVFVSGKLVSFVV